jgi:hypothetical protein
MLRKYLKKTEDWKPSQHYVGQKKEFVSNHCKSLWYGGGYRSVGVEGGRSGREGITGQLGGRGIGKV